MSLTNAEFASIVDDQSKRIAGDIVWSEDEDHSPSVEFRAEVESSGGWPLFVRGSYNPLAKALSYALILKTTGRIYGLDLGKDHHNPNCQQVGDKHKHRWSEQSRDRDAYIPADITEPASNPVEVWSQFCKEANILHDGRMSDPPPFQKELFL